MQKITIIGAGYAGCCMARNLTDKGYDVEILEMTDSPGGLAKSYEIEGMTYEFGPHIIANHNCGQEVLDFILSFVEVEKTSMETATWVQGKCLRYPPNINDIDLLDQKEQIKKEIENLSEDIDETNFETYLISKVGKSLYEIYFKNFTEKFWGVKPSTLSAEWAKIRHLGESLRKEKMFFNENWCSYPKKDFNELFRNITKGITITYNCKIEKVDLDKQVLKDANGNEYEYDFLINTMSLDTFFNYEHGKLDYAGYKIEPQVIENEYYHPAHPISGEICSMVYYPENNVAQTRTTEYKCFNNKKDQAPFKNKTVITVETPIKSDDYRFYPFSDENNEEIFNKYVEELSKYGNVLSIGRMGLYKYQTLDTTTAQVFRLMDIFDKWQNYTNAQRKEKYLKVIR